MNVFQLLKKERVRFNSLRHIGFLPNGKISLLKKKWKNIRFGFFDILSKFLGGELFEISDETGNIRGRNEEMNMIQHKDETENL